MIAGALAWLEHWLLWAARQAAAAIALIAWKLGLSVYRLYAAIHNRWYNLNDKATDNKVVLRGKAALRK